MTDRRLDQLSTVSTIEPTDLVGLQRSPLLPRAISGADILAWILSEIPPPSPGGGGAGLNIVDYGAIPGSANATATTAALNDAADDALATGTYVYAPPDGGDGWWINGRVRMDHVDLRGEGSWLTTFVCANAGAGIDFGDLAAGYAGSHSHGFTVDGNDVATLSLQIGAVVDGMFSDIAVKNTDRDDPDSIGLYVFGTQNCLFLQLQIKIASICVRLDGGASNNTFVKCEIERAAYKHVEFRALDQTGPIESPGGNHFIDCLLEYGYSTHEYLVDHLAGYWNRFTFGSTYVIAFPEAFTPLAHFRARGEDYFQSSLIVEGVLVGDAIASGAIGLLSENGAEGAGVIHCGLHNSFVTVATVMKGLVYVSDQPAVFGATTLFDQTGFAVPQKFIPGVQESGVYSAGSSVVRAVSVGADAHASYYDTARGKRNYGSGAASTDTDWARIATALIGSTVDIIARAGAATQVQLGSVGGQPGIMFGNPLDVGFVRVAANVLAMLNGDVFRFASTTTALRPSAATVGAGSVLWDVDTDSLIVSDGTNWEVVDST